MDINELCRKLANTSWLPKPTNAYLTNSHGNEAKLNLAWALSGRPNSIGQAFFDDSRTMAVWFLAGEVVKQNVEGALVSEHLTLLSPEDFLKLVERHPEIFRQFMPITTWQKAFKR